MRSELINRFMDEVGSGSAETLLPSSLPEEWLDILASSAREYLKALSEQSQDREDMPDNETPPEPPSPDASQDQEKSVDLFETEPAMLLLTAVLEILQADGGYDPTFEPSSLPEGRLYDAISCYAMHLIYEFFSRNAPELPACSPPGLDDIFDPELILEFEEAHPEITHALHAFITGNE